jgi:cyclopropane fatty-acyl-phospholipid synthase-like methyltransferase
MARLSHEQKVERFYSHGAGRRAVQDDGSLCFGYWTEATADYRQATRDLLSLVLEGERPAGRGTVLNVACGNGTETFRIWEALRPERIVAIDVTGAHVAFARQAAEQMGLAGRISFEKADACAFSRPPNTMSYVIGIEGPAHFNTRAAFLERAYDLLEPDGVLLLTDVIMDGDVARRSLRRRLLAGLCARQWHVPRANWCSLSEYRRLLGGIGFAVESLESIGEHVFPGFVRYNLRWSSLVNAMRTRGCRIGLGLTFISWLLGLAYRWGLCDYVHVRATKAPAPERPPSARVAKELSISRL